MADKAVEIFGTVLSQMAVLKPPGVSGSKIKSLTEISIENVESESILIQKLYTHFKKTPGSHKLGVLYAVDSIVRAYIDEARKAGQDPTLEGPDGTFSAGVHRITGLLSSLMNDIMIHAPDDTKEKIKKLMDIWQRGSTFPSDLINSIRAKHFASPQQSPATDSAYQNASLPFSNNSQPTSAQPESATAPNTAAILQALAQMAKTNPPSSTPAPPAPPTPVTTQAPSHIPNFAGLGGAGSAAPPAAQLPVSLPNFGAQPPSQSTAPPANLQSLLPGLLGGNYGNAATAQPAPPAQPAFPNLNMQPSDPNVMTQFALLQMLTQSMNQNQLAQALEQAGKQNGPAAYNQSWQQPSQSNPYERYDDHRGGTFSPGRERFRRSRSRSPGYGDEVPIRRRSPVYGEYAGNANGEGRDRDYNKRGGRGNRGGANNSGRGYRRDRSASPPRQELWDGRAHPSGQKFVEFDESLKPDKIRVYSRTLFVGGVSSSEQELRQLFQQHGEVQSCIVNFEKRHAFIKMKTRSDAARAKDALETHRLPHSVLRTRWGVGFGPRDCCDYATGISEITLDRLTDADRRWLQTAEFGGIGDRSIEGGLVLEEPDIEIGQGVSSKAISRRMQTDHAGARGPKSSFQRYDRENSNNYDTRREYNNGPDRDVSAAVPISTVPGFGGFGGGYAPLIYQQPGQQ
ncbi:hypothetical protein H072_7288 [Dactylellina haptotyla CBS 200.50]|uniref:RRM domain-containing protein n=1 Tax=Dactylellina haptotyla (strain CBS 200.50) TaxID=1284197 RepID=S8A7I8_DACHA|nr:hypothetical protein H072_7288 [Dactylellina haptotyla CBS 200.50]